MRTNHLLHSLLTRMLRVVLRTAGSRQLNPQAMQFIEALESTFDVLQRPNRRNPDKHRISDHSAEALAQSLEGRSGLLNHPARTILA